MVEHIGDFRDIQRTPCAQHAQKEQIYFQLRVVGLRHELIDKTIGYDGNVGAAVLIDFQTAHNLTCFPVCTFFSFRAAHLLVRLKAGQEAADVHPM